MLVVSHEGASSILEAALGFGAFPAWDIHLMGTAGVPLHGWTLADYLALELPVTAGYNVQTIPGSLAGWTPNTITAGERFTSVILTWTFTGALTVFGWFASFAATSISICGEEFSPAFTFGSGGGTFTWLLPLDLISCPGVSAC